MMSIAVIVQGISSIMMMTIIILVQVVIYPQFQYVGINNLQVYAQQHIRRISYIVIPVMISELASLVLLWTISGIPIAYLGLATVLLISIWLLTFLAIVPVHQKIAYAANQSAIPRLIRLNFYRTILWALKTLCIIGIILELI